MKAKRFTIYGDNLAEPVTKFLRQFYQEAYVSEYPGGMLFAYEDFSVMNGNQLMVCMRLDLTQANTGKALIEVIAGGGSSSIFFDEWWGSERRRIRDFRQELKSFCEEMKYQFEESET